jgi:hypothetical protein
MCKVVLFYFAHCLIYKINSSEAGLRPGMRLAQQGGLAQLGEWVQSETGLTRELV